MNILLSEAALPVLIRMNAATARVFWLMVSRRMGDTNVALLPWFECRNEEQRVINALKRLARMGLVARISTKVYWITAPWLLKEPVKESLDP